MDEEIKPVGRPRIEIPLATVEQLAQLGCTNKEIAAQFGVSERTIESRRQEPDFREAWDRGVAKGNISLRRKQFAQAMAGDRTMLIWLGKQRLGQKDKVSNEHSGPGGGPIHHAVDLSGLSEEELALLESLASKARDPEA
jgi:hypothetical protein